MIDIKQIRENPKRFIKAAADKNIEVDIDRLLEDDSKLGAAKKGLQDIATEKNSLGKSIPKLVADEKQSALARLAELKENDTNLNDQVKDLQP